MGVPPVPPSLRHHVNRRVGSDVPVVLLRVAKLLAPVLLLRRELADPVPSLLPARLLVVVIRGGDGDGRPWSVLVVGDAAALPGPLLGAATAADGAIGEVGDALDGRFSDAVEDALEIVEEDCVGGAFEDKGELCVNAALLATFWFG